MQRIRMFGSNETETIMETPSEQVLLEAIASKARVRRHLETLIEASRASSQSGTAVERENHPGQQAETCPGLVGGSSVRN